VRRLRPALILADGYCPAELVFDPAFFTYLSYQVKVGSRRVL